MIHQFGLSNYEMHLSFINRSWENFVTMCCLCLRKCVRVWRHIIFWPHFTKNACRASITQKVMWPALCKIIGGSRGGMPGMPFRHTKFSKCNRLQSPRPHYEVDASYRKSWIRHWRCLAQVIMKSLTWKCHWVKHKHKLRKPEVVLCTV